MKFRMTRSTPFPDESCRTHVDRRSYVAFILSCCCIRVQQSCSSASAVPIVHGLLVVSWAAQDLIGEVRYSRMLYSSTAEICRIPTDVDRFSFLRIGPT